MARIFDLKITSVAVECSLGYDVYYDIVNPNNFATNVATGNLATGIPLFLFQRPNGFRVSVPDLATSVIIYDPCCGISQEFIINGDDPCFIGDKTEFEATECLKLDTVINACYVSYLNYDNQIETLNITQSDIGNKIEICVLGGEKGLIADSCGFKPNTPKCFCAKYFLD
jgi:hypothetical protein